MPWSQIAESVTRWVKMIPTITPTPPRCGRGGSGSLGCRGKGLAEEPLTVV